MAKADTVTQRNKFIIATRDCLGRLDELVGAMPHRGAACYDSQKVCLQIALNDFYSLVVGVDRVDFEPLTEPEDSV